MKRGGVNKIILTSGAVLLCHFDWEHTFNYSIMGASLAIIGNDCRLYITADFKSFIHFQSRLILPRSHLAASVSHFVSFSCGRETCEAHKDM